MTSAKKPWVARIHLGGGKYQWVGRYATKRERDKAKREALNKLEQRRPSGTYTVEEYVARFLAEYEQTHKDSSTDTARSSLKKFREKYGQRLLDSFDRIEAKDITSKLPRSSVPMIVTMFNHAVVEDEILDRHSFHGLGRRTKGREEEPPPTPDEFDLLLDSCSALKEYAPTIRAFTKFAAFTIMRPGELYPLEWADIDFDAMRIRVERRLYRGQLALPKSGKPKLIALTPPARDAILGLARTGPLVFTAKRGGRLSQSVMSGYWNTVLTKAGLEFDFYHATKHYGVHYMWTKLGMSDRAIAVQAGWSLESVRKMLKVYGHGDIGALDEVDEAFAQAPVTSLSAVRDAKETQTDA